MTGTEYLLTKKSSKMAGWLKRIPFKYFSVDFKIVLGHEVLFSLILR